MHQLPTWAWGFALASGVAVSARLVGALSTSGSLAAIVVGTLVMAAGWGWGVLLVAYFVTASGLSHFRAADKRRRTGDRAEKAGARDALQVLANGGLFAAAAVAYAAAPRAIWQVVGVAALSASAADTWATELGVLSDSPPRSILTRQRVPAGTSGGVSPLGFAASAAGATLTAAVAWLARWPSSAIVSAVVGGVAGSVLDSIAGATVQARRHCPACDEATERRVHRCGQATHVTGGISWMDNDAVNAVSTLGGALVGAAAARLF